jgi:hypothetical protein
VMLGCGAQGVEPLGPRPIAGSLIFHTRLSGGYFVSMIFCSPVCTMPALAAESLQ